MSEMRGQGEEGGAGVGDDHVKGLDLEVVAVEGGPVEEVVGTLDVYDLCGGRKEVCYDVEMRVLRGFMLPRVPSRYGD